MNPENRLRIAFLSVNDPLDKRSWSGTTYYIGQALQRNVGDVQYLGPLLIPRWLDKTLRATAKFNRLLFKKEYAVKYSLLLSWYASRQFHKKIRDGHFDCIVAPAAATELSYLSTSLPVVYISDTTFELISRYYRWEFSNMLGYSRWEGNHLEKRSLYKSAFIIYSSVWAKNSAIKDYGIPAEKIGVMPLGANMDNIPRREVIHLKDTNPTLTLLFLAVEWERKGGPIAYKAVETLRQNGRNTRLIVCGCIPPDQYAAPWMQVIPFLNKNIPEQHQQFVSLLSSVHFLILPTRADCSLLVACESNAYGVPALSTLTGGVPDVVLDGVNGYCLPYEAGGEEYAALVEEIYSDAVRYRKLVETSRQRFEEHLNWDKWAEKFMSLYEKHIGLKQRRQTTGNI